MERADTGSICTALETAVSREPAGIMITGWFPDAFAPMFEKAWRAGEMLAPAGGVSFSGSQGSILGVPLCIPLMNMIRNAFSVFGINL